MALKFTTITLDRSGGVASPVEIDITARHRDDQSQFQPTGSEGGQSGKLDISFLYTEAYNLQEYQEWWAGWRDTTTHAWSLVDPAGNPALVHGGYIVVQEGSARGPRHTILDTLADYDIDLITTDVEIWPDHSNMNTPYPGGRSATEWLVGTAAGGSPFDGLIPARLRANGGYVLDGVDPVFNSLIFSIPQTGVMPGTSDNTVPNPGHFAFVDLKSAIDDIVAGVRFIDGTKDPVYTVEAVIDPGDPTKIRPRFRMIDRYDVSGPAVAVFAVDPGVGEWPIEEPFAHIRDVVPGEVRQRVLLKGNSTDPVTGALVYAVAYNPNRPVQPTVYQTDPGRSGKPFNDTRINTVAMAQSIAARLEEWTWGPIGTIRFRTTRPTRFGEIIALRIPQEGQNLFKYRVARVNAIPGTIRKYDVELGSPRPNMGAALQRIAAKANALQQLAALGLPTPGGQTGLPGAPRRMPVVSNPTHSKENVIMAANDSAVGLVQQPGFVPVGGTPNPNPAHQRTTQDALKNVRDWDANDGTNHPHHYPVAGPITTAQETFFRVPDPARLVREEISNRDGTLNTGVTTAYQRARAGAIVGVPNPTVSTPLICARGDVLIITFAGTFPTAGVTLTVSEAPVLP